jgi:iron complex transport system substrate-binding protein
VLRTFWIGLAFWAALSGAAANAAPERIVSLSLCTDQLLLTLAPRERITALTYLATRPDLSTLWQEAHGIPQVRGSAEEVLSLQPDLVLAGTFGARPTVRLLRQFGIPILTLPPAEDFASVREQIRQVAEAIGEPGRGAVALAALDQDLAQLAITPPRTGAFYRQSGYTSGSGTLADAIMQAASMANVAVAAGVRGSGYLPLERLLIERPDWLITSDYKRDVPTLGNRLLSHPALRGAAGGEFVLPGHLTSCGGGWNVRATRLLAALPPVR